MFDVDRFYHAARNAEPIAVSGFGEYIKSFENVVLWGAGYLGNEIGKKFKELNLPITAYWDMRASEIGSLHGFKAIEPFQGGYDKSRTLVVFCITNCFVRDRLKIQLADEGYSNVLIGEYLYQALICPIDEYDGFAACKDSLACDAFTCDRNDVLFKKSLSLDESDPAGEILFRNVTFVINQKCTLKCKYCYSYTNSYPADKRINFPLEQIKRDIDIFFDTVDGVKFIPLIGGETFLHPDISKIVKKFLEKSNFGILNVTTNGICRISPEQLDGLQQKRVQVVFSNYKESLTPEQNDLFDSNVDFVKSSGAKVIVLNSTPQWVIPTSLDDKHYSVEQMINKKEACLNPLSCKYVKNGKFYPCTVADSIHNIGVADYKEDYVELAEGVSRAQLRGRIKALVSLPYYRSCGHCDGTCGQMGLISKAGEQGYQEFVNV